ncbi:MAG: hypothetical protein M5R36_18190 [Deltaproteobacteria bacterium]|nr:hypothetical protein [Deltaproteobacteria bacterium]
MTVRRGDVFAFVTVLLIVLPLAARAESLSSIMGYPYKDPSASWPGPNYASVKPVSESPIFSRVSHIIYPVIGFPAMIRPGDTFKMYVKYQSPDSLRKTSDYVVNLTTASVNDDGNLVGDPVRQRYTLLVTNVEFDWDFYAYVAEMTVPEDIPEDVYNLELDTDFFFDIQPNAVSVHRERDVFRFAHLTDVQYADPSGALGQTCRPHDYPGYDAGFENTAILNQAVRHEWPLLDIDFAIGTGDFIFGADAHGNNETFHDIMQWSRAAVFMVPGAHDGLSFSPAGQRSKRRRGIFLALLRPALLLLQLRSLSFHRDRQLRRIGASPAGRRRETGASGRQLGRLSFAGATRVDRGGSGRRQRRRPAHRGVFAPRSPAAPMSPTIPTVPTPTTATASAKTGITIRIPGIRTATADSAAKAPRIIPASRCSSSSPQVASRTFSSATGTRMPWTSSGAGQTILDRDGGDTGVTAQGAIAFIETTTLAGQTEGALGYWGYRVIEVRGGEISRVDYSDAPLYGSIPAGNFHAQGAGNDGTNTEASVTVTNSLPTPMDVTVAFFMAAVPEGYVIENVETGAEVAPFQIGIADDGGDRSLRACPGGAGQRLRHLPRQRRTNHDLRRPPRGRQRTAGGGDRGGRGRTRRLYPAGGQRVRSRRRRHRPIRLDPDRRLPLRRRGSALSAYHETARTDHAHRQRRARRPGNGHRRGRPQHARQAVRRRRQKRRRVRRMRRRRLRRRRVSGALLLLAAVLLGLRRTGRRP